MHLGGGADQHPVAGVHQEGPVRAALLLQQPPEERQRELGREVFECGVEVAPDHEVGALAVADLLLDHPADDRGVRIVVHVERATGKGDRQLWQEGEEFGQGEDVLFGHRKGLQRGAVVVCLETALADLSVRDEREQVVHRGAAGRDAAAHREVGEVLVAVDGAHQHLDGVRGETRGAAVQQGECGRVRGGETGEQVGGRGHGYGFLPNGWTRAVLDPLREGRLLGCRRPPLRAAVVFASGTRDRWATLGGGPPPGGVVVRVHEFESSGSCGTGEADHVRCPRCVSPIGQWSRFVRVTP